jgi:HEAT repeat protein
MQERLNRERKELLPIIEALKEQSAALTHALADSDAQVRELARRALEDVTSPQLHLLGRVNQVAAGPGAEAKQPFHLTSSSAANPLLENLQAMVQALAVGLTDPDVRARRAVVDVLESVGPAAAPAAQSLVTALKDPDRFVRWAAARTLGKIAPVEADSAVPALAELLRDHDLDLRLAAALALERYGPAAKPAVPELIEGVKSTEPQLRVAAIRALGAVGGADGGQAVPVLGACLRDTEPRVRQWAATVLGKFGPVAIDAEDWLRDVLEDPSPAVQKAAGDALLRIKSPVQK